MSSKSDWYLSGSVKMQNRKLSDTREDAFSSHGSLCIAFISYAQIWSSPSPSVAVGVQSGNGKRQAITRASSGNSFSSFLPNTSITPGAKKTVTLLYLDKSVFQKSWFIKVAVLDGIPFHFALTLAYPARIELISKPVHWKPSTVAANTMYCGEKVVICRKPSEASETESA